MIPPYSIFLETNTPPHLAMIPTYSIFCSRFNYWSFSNKVFLKIKSLKKKKKKLETNTPPHLAMTVQCLEGSK